MPGQQTDDVKTEKGNCSEIQFRKKKLKRQQG